MHRVATVHVMVLGLLVLGPRVVAAAAVQSWTGDQARHSCIRPDRLDRRRRGPHSRFTGQRVRLHLRLASPGV